MFRCAKRNPPPQPAGWGTSFPKEALAAAAGTEELPWRLAGEVLNTYIIVERGDTVYLIDKHAAHERLNFDREKAAG